MDPMINRGLKNAFGLAYPCTFEHITVIKASKITLNYFYLNFRTVYTYKTCKVLPRSF